MHLLCFLFLTMSLFYCIFIITDIQYIYTIMIFNQDIFQVKIEQYDAYQCLHYVKIETIDSKLEAFIDEHISSIWNAEKRTDKSVIIAKKELAKYFKDKDPDKIKGSIAEFILHLYLKAIGFTQNCLFRNLEEGSIKKGFDGYYSYSNEEWIMESKSGSIQTNGITHISKLNESYKDLKSKIEGKSKNNPWTNALHHATIANVDNDILKNIKILSDNFTLEEFPKITDFNIIPSSTIFYDELNQNYISSEDFSNISKLKKTFTSKMINIVCIDKNSIDDILRFITE